MVYAEAPWIFKGRALYQLQLVKADEARKHIPPGLKLVEFCGYTLGGVYLARYEDSPAGVFDECVAMAGLVWNPPTSCAWAARVFVNSRAARDHGIRCVGLPSRLAAFSQLSQAAGSSHAWWRRGSAKQQDTAALAAGAAGSEVVELRNTDPGQRGLPNRPVAVFRLPAVAASGFLGPRLRLSLPSFSGGTREHPALLQYSCDLQTNVMPVAPLDIQLPSGSSSSSTGACKDTREEQCGGRGQAGARSRQQQAHPEVLDLLLNGRPLMCLAFSDMVMRVDEPTRLHLRASQHARTQAPQPQGMPALATLLPRK